MLSHPGPAIGVGGQRADETPQSAKGPEIAQPSASPGTTLSSDDDSLMAAVDRPTAGRVQHDDGVPQVDFVFRVREQNV
jgi:hypothetical protein